MRCFGRKFLIWLSLMFLFILVGRLLVNRGFYLPILIISTSDILIPKSYSSSQQDVQTGAFAFAAGMYMAGLQPRNRSFCRWYHGLPNMLSYPASKVSWSPEIGEKSPYRVLPFILRGTEERNKLPQVTLCTHATADQVYGIVELARRWEGPLSLAVFTPGLDANIAVALLDRACRCEPEMYKVFPMHSLSKRVTSSTIKPQTLYAYIIRMCIYLSKSYLASNFLSYQSNIQYTIDDIR